MDQGDEPILQRRTEGRWFARLVVGLGAVLVADGIGVLPWSGTGEKRSGAGTEVLGSVIARPASSATFATTTLVTLPARQEGGASTIQSPSSSTTAPTAPTRASTSTTRASTSTTTEPTTTTTPADTTTTTTTTEPTTTTVVTDAPEPPPTTPAPPPEP